MSGVDVIEQPLTATEARDLTDRIRKTLRIGHDLIVTAFKGQAWTALGYATWDDYCSGEFAEARMVRLDRQQRREIVAEMSEAGMSTRAIASGLGIGRGTVERDLPPVPTGTPAPVAGLDGKTYTRPAPAAVVIDGEVVDTATGEVAPTREPNRRPLPDLARDAGWELRQAVDRITKVLDDDRHARNAEQVDNLLAAHLIYAADVIASAVERTTSNTPKGTS